VYAQVFTGGEDVILAVVVLRDPEESVEAANNRATAVIDPNELIARQCDRAGSEFDVHKIPLNNALR
jgi:hypothetical protein